MLNRSESNVRTLKFSFKTGLPTNFVYIANVCVHNACKCNCVCLPESKSLSGPWLEADSEREFADTETKSFHYVSAEITATSKDNFYFRWDALTYKQTSKPTRYVQAAKWYFKTSSELANRNSKKNNFVFTLRVFDFAKKNWPQRQKIRCYRCTCRLVTCCKMRFVNIYQILPCHTVCAIKKKKVPVNV